MSLVLDPNKPWTDDEKEWARSSGRAHLISANERRFPEGKVSKGDKVGQPEGNASFGLDGSEARSQAVYDVGGAPLPGTTLDYDTGRALQFDAEGNGITVEPERPVNAPGAYAPWVEPEGFASIADGGDDIDDDIVDFVLGLKTKADVQKELKKHKVGYSSDDDRDTLNDKLAVKLQDERHPEAAAAMAEQAAKAEPVPVHDEEQPEE